MEPNNPPQDQIAVIHDVLASERRRNTLSYLTACSDRIVSREDIVDALLDCEPGEPGPTTHRELLEIDLHHVHLPKLADAVVIDYDSTSGTVEYRASADLESLLSRNLTSKETDS